jgi:hypothetical protein
MLQPLEATYHTISLNKNGALSLGWHQKYRGLWRSASPLLTLYDAADLPPTPNGNVHFLQIESLPILDTMQRKSAGFTLYIATIYNVLYTVI